MDCSSLSLVDRHVLKLLSHRCTILVTCQNTYKPQHDHDTATAASKVGRMQNADTATQALCSTAMMFRAFTTPRDLDFAMRMHCVAVYAGPSTHDFADECMHQVKMTRSRHVPGCCFAMLCTGQQTGTDQRIRVFTRSGMTVSLSSAKQRLLVLTCTAFTLHPGSVFLSCIDSLSREAGCTYT